MDDVFVLLDIVSLFDQAAKDHAKFVLGGGHFVVVLVHPNAHTLHGRQHFRPQVLRAINRVHREIAALVGRTVGQVAAFKRCIGIPSRIFRIDLIRHFVGGNLIAHVVEDEEFSFGAEIGSVANARGFQIGFRLQRDLARATIISLVCVGLDHVAMHAECFLGIEGVHVDRCRIGHQFHVGLVNRLPSGNRGPVEHKAFFKEVFVDQIRHQRHVLQLAFGVGKTDVDVFDVFVLDQFQSFLDCAHHAAFRVEVKTMGWDLMDPSV